MTPIGWCLCHSGRRPAAWTGAQRSFGGAYRVLDVYVYGLVPNVRGEVDGRFPVEVGGEQLVSFRQEFVDVAKVVDLSRAELPGSAKLGDEAVVEAAELQFAHVVDGLLVHFHVEHDRA